MKRVETKLNDDSVSVFLLIYQKQPIFYVHGVFTNETKVLAELKRLSKIPKNKLTKEEKRINKNCPGKEPRYSDPMDAYSIREVTLNVPCC